MEALVNECGEGILQVCDIKDSKDLGERDTTEFTSLCKDDLPVLRKKEIKTYDILEAMSKK